MQPGSDITEAFNRLVIAVNAIEKVAPFAHDDHLGFLSACPANLGTGLRASIHVKLPLLSTDQSRLTDIADAHGVNVRGIGV